MENNKIEFCKKIFEVIKQDRMRWWGKHIDEFIDSLLMLTKEEFLEFKQDIPPDVKFHLMSQVLGSHGKYFISASNIEKQRMLTQVHIMVFLENFEFDYRETLLRIDSFGKKTMSSSIDRDTIWRNVEKYKTDNYDTYMK